MIIAIEGPDRSGKSTLAQLLAHRLKETPVKCILSWGLPKELVPVLSHFEQKQEQLWWELYNPRQLYVCDRHVAVSAPIYDRLFERQCLVDWKRWTMQIHVLYVEVPIAELERRHRATNEQNFPIEHYKQVRELYAEHLLHFRVTYLDGTSPPNVLADNAMLQIARYK